MEQNDSASYSYFDSNGGVDDYEDDDEDFFFFLFNSSHYTKKSLLHQVLIQQNMYSSIRLSHLQVKIIAIVT